MISLPTFAGLAPAAATETQSVLSMLYQRSYAQSVPNEGASAHNETRSSITGNALSWDSQRQMHAELSLMETVPAGSLSVPANLPGALTSTDAHRFESAALGLVSISPNPADSPVMSVRDVPAAQIKDATAPIIPPSSPGIALSILDLQAGTVYQADLPQTEDQAASSEPGQEATESVSPPRSPPISQLEASIVSLDPVAPAIPIGLGSKRTSGGKASIPKSAISAQASQAASDLSVLAIVPQPTTSPIASRAKRDLPSNAGYQTLNTLFASPSAPSIPDRTHTLDESVLAVADHVATFPSTTVKTASQLAANPTSAEPTIASTAVGTGAWSRTGDASPQSVVDHLSFELVLRRQNPGITSNDPGGKDDSDASSLTFAPRLATSPSATLTSLSGPNAFEFNGASEQVSAKRNIDPPNAGPANAAAQSTSSGGTPAFPAEMLPTPFVSHATLKQEGSGESVSAGPPIDLPETKAQTPQSVVHDVQLRLQGETGENVSVRLSDRSGQVQISVRSSDQVTATMLRQDLSTLSATLEKQGWKTDLPGSPLQTVLHDARDPSNPQQSDQQGRQRSLPEWQDPPDRKRQSPSDQWAEMNEQETK